MVYGMCRHLSQIIGKDQRGLIFTNDRGSKVLLTTAPLIRLHSDGFIVHGCSYLTTGVPTSPLLWHHSQKRVKDLALDK